MSTLPTTWVETNLGTVVPYGATIKAEPEELTPDTWVLELEDIEKDTTKVLQRLTFSERQSRSTKNRFDAGDVLYGKLRPYLNKVAFAEQPGVCTTEIVPIKPNDAVNGRYLFHWLRHPKFLVYVTEVSHGVNMPRLGTEAGRQAPFVLAPKNEQKRIADKLDAVLTRVDTVNTRMARVAAILKRFRQSVLADATSGRLTKDWRTTVGTANDWPHIDVQSVAHVGTGSTPLRSNPTFFSSVGTPWVTSAATGNELVQNATEFVTQAAITAHRLKVYPPGTLLVAMYGEGKTRGQVTELGISATINQACAAIVVDEAKMLRSFVKLGLQANYFEMRVLAEGGNQPNLNLAKIKGFPLPYPPLNEQAEIVRRVATLFAFADRLEARLQTAQTATERLTPALLAKAFRGEMVPQDPNDEPASELLRRMQQEAPSTSTRRGRKSAA